MEKILKVFLLSLLVFGTVGCSGGIDGEKIIKNIEEKGYVLGLNFDTYDGVFGLNDKCYEIDGIEKPCSRIISDLNKKPLLQIINKGDVVNYSSNDKGVLITGMFDEYMYYKNSEYESVYIYDSKKGESCSYYYKGKGDTETVCDESKKAEADKVKEKTETLLKDVGLSVDEFSEFGKWFLEGKGAELTESLKKKQAEQVPLTNTEIAKLIKLDYDIINNDKLLIMSKTFNNWFGLMKNSDGKFNGVMYYYDYYSGDKSTNKMTMAYMYDTKTYVSLNDTATCGYDLTNEKVLEGKKCSEEQISDAKMLKYIFEDEIDGIGVTVDEFVNFVKTYK